MPESVLDWGIQLILSLQGLGDWLIGPMNAFTFLGNEDFYLLLFPFLYWCVESSMGIRIGVYLVVSIGLNNLLKTAFTDPRPYWYDPRVELLAGAESTFGIPSGHAQNAVVIWSGIASQIRQGWAWAAAIGLALLIGFSRIYLGTHFPTDVFAGWFFGIIILLLAIRLENPVVAWISRFGTWQKVGIYFGISLLFIILHGMVLQWVNASFTLPAPWGEAALADAPEEPIAPLSISGTVTIMAAAFGFLSGVAWLKTRGGFNVQGTWLIRVSRFVIGIIGVMVLRYGLDYVFGLIAADETIIGYILRYIRYGTIGFWISALAPLVFVRLKLANAPQRELS
jgi:membrane-associated phospholipid phosphatase